MKEIVMLGFLAVSVWQDLKRQEIDVWVYLVFGSLIWFCRLCSEGPLDLSREVVNVIPGLLMVALSRWSGGALGEGDGWFFVVSGIMLGFYRNTAAITAGILFCGLWCGGMFVWNRRKGIGSAGKTVPFLPFAALGVMGSWLI